MIYLDTHVAAWLYAGRMDLFTPKGLRLLEEHDLAVSPAVLLELEYLREIGRLGSSGRAIVQGLQAQIGLKICGRAFGAVVDTAIDLNWTRDPFDRLIVAQAATENATLLTKDRAIRRHYREAVW